MHCIGDVYLINNFGALLGEFPSGARGRRKEIAASIKSGAQVGAVSGCRFRRQASISQQGHNEKQTLRIFVFAAKTIATHAKTKFIVRGHVNNEMNHSF